MSRLDDLIALKAYELDCLKNLRDIWKTGDCNTCKRVDCEWKPQPGEMVRYNCPHYVKPIVRRNGDSK